MNQAEVLRAEIARAARTIGAPDDTTPVLERPRDVAHGDWATNVAMTLAKPLGKKPREIAEALVAAMDLAAVGVSSAEIAGPGFVNFRFDPAFLARGLLAIIERPDAWGRVDVGHGVNVVVEFVSANPTGPLHVGHGRQAALGDAISTLLEWTGWDVDREFYYNDAGTQIANLAKSTQARVRELGVTTRDFVVTITGTNLLNVTVVTIGGSPLVNLSVVSSTQVTGQTPPGAGC